jgi:hypothetical protein
MNPGAPSETYLEFYTFLVKQAKTHDIAIPFKRSTRQAHKANFDFFLGDIKIYHWDGQTVLDCFKLDAAYNTQYAVKYPFLLKF